MRWFEKITPPKRGRDPALSRRGEEQAILAKTNGMPVWKIADELDVSKSTIERVLKKHKAIQDPILPSELAAKTPPKLPSKRPSKTVTKTVTGSPEVAEQAEVAPTLAEPPDPAQAAWTQLLSSVSASVSPDRYDRWLEPTRALALRGNTLLVSVPDESYQDYIPDRLGDVLAEALGAQVVGPDHVRVGAIEFVVEGQEDDS